MTTVKRGDTHAITFTVTDESGAPVDLTDATVRLLARRRSVGAALTVLTASVTDATNGVVSHTLTGVLEAATYDIELEVTADGEITTAPSDSYLTLTVVKDLRDP